MLKKKILRRLIKWRLFFLIKDEIKFIFLLLLFLLTTFSRFLELLGFGLAVKIIFNNEIFSNYFDNIVSFDILLLFFLVIVLRCVFQSLVDYFKQLILINFENKLRQEAFNSLFFSESLNIRSTSRGEVISMLLTDISRSTFALDKGITTILGLISVITYLFILVLLDYQRTFPILIALSATLLAALIKPSKGWEIGVKKTDFNNKIHRLIGDGLFGITGIKASGSQSLFLKNFYIQNNNFKELILKTIKRKAFFNFFRDMLVLFCICIWIISLKGSVTFIQLSSILIFSYRIAILLSNVINSQRLCMISLPGYRQLLKIRNKFSYKEIKKTSFDDSEELIRNKVNLDSVIWESGNQNLLINQIKISKGEIYCITGISGSGKTTLLNSFCGLINERKSKWSFVKNDRTNFKKGNMDNNLHKLVSYAPDKTFLFEGSLRDNLLLGFDDPAIDKSELDKKIIEWLNVLNLSYLIGRNHGLNGRLNLSLECFSFGEIKRLGLIRAWIKNKEIEVLDEPTSNLDNFNADIIRKIIQKRSQKKMVLISTHDKDFIIECNKIVKLDNYK